jgi:hypothetical protein
MWPLNKKVEVKISHNFGESYFNELVSFLESSFSAQFIRKKAVEMDLSFFEYSIDKTVITIMSEGMNGTSLLGDKKTVDEIIEKAKKEKPQLVENIL